MKVMFILRVGLESDPTVQVFGFDNPVTSLVEFKPNFYDLLLIDVNMPLMDGFQLAWFPWNYRRRTKVMGFKIAVSKNG